MEVGDMIKLPIGAKTAHDIVSKVAILTEKIPRQDYLEYDWKVFADGRFFGVWSTDRRFSRGFVW